MYYKDFWILKLKKSGGLVWEKTYGGPYMEKADDVVALEDGGYAMIGDMCSHNYNISTCGSVAKVLYIRVDEDGEKVEEKSWSGLNFIERIPYFSITTTSSGGIAWTAEHKNKGSWVHKWGPMEDTTTIYTNGYGGSQSPEYILNETGIDISGPEFWQGGFDYIKGMIDELDATM